MPADDGMSVGMTLSFEEALHEENFQLDVIKKLAAAQKQGDTSLDEISEIADRAMRGG